MMTPREIQRALSLPIKHTKFGHITPATHEQARRLAQKFGVAPTHLFKTADGRLLRVYGVYAHWTGRAVARVRNTKTGREGTWLVASIVLERRKG